eukprot:TRINITY_DN22475_c0_g1_i1.p1 TRINITY_DN22475_c0_g1~~TRINITY_DN22475_c0_g1_i1.p1  ORF type:complete len:412 (+),score=39.53 TRINITY_DN22475_c0_g1_i1:69-1304(+)
MRRLLRTPLTRLGARCQSTSSADQQPDAEYWRIRASQLEEKLLAAQQFMGQCARQSSGFDDACKGWEYWDIDKYGSQIDYNTFFEANSKAQRPCVFSGLDVVPQEWGDIDFWKKSLSDTEVPIFVPNRELPRGFEERSPERFIDFSKNGSSRAFYGPEATPLDLKMCEVPLPETEPQVLENFTIPKYFSQDLVQFCMQSEALRTSQLQNRSELEATRPRAALPLLYMGDDEAHIVSGLPLLTVAPRGMTSSLYKTPYNQHTWIHVTSGSVEIILFSPMYSPAIYETGNDTYMLDAFAPDFEMFPSAIMPFPWRVTVTAGETLFIPADVAFQWRCAADSIFTTMNFTDWSNVELALYDYERMAACGHPAFAEIIKGFNSSFVSLPECSKADEPVDTPYGAFLTWKNEVHGKG